jgi:hypothetical protein
MITTNWRDAMQETDVKTEIGNLPIEAKFAVIFRLADCIDETKTPDVRKGLETLFHAMIADMVSIKVEQRH